MKKLPRGKVVRETKRYDDLLKTSLRTKKVLKETGAAFRQSLFGRIQSKSSSDLTPVKVHLRSKKAANQFAALVRQTLRSSNKKIVFSGNYDERRNIVRVASRLPVAKCVFLDDKKKSSAMKTKRKTWNTDDFFSRTWIDMPPFENEAVSACVSFHVSFPTIDDKIAFAELIKQPLSNKTKSIWFPHKERVATTGLVWIGRKETCQPRYPVFIVSKGRAQYGPLTAKVLRDLNVPFYLMVEPHEYDKYRVLCDWAKDVFVIPESNHGMGPGRARNACWDVAKNVMKTKRHWVLDDNIAAFLRLHENERIRVGDGTIFRAAEDFVDRYENIPISGFGYKFFHPATEKQYPFKVNTRIYSCLLIDNDCPYRWRGRWNEDTILSLDVLKDVRKNETYEELNARKKDGSYKNARNKRYATVEFVAFLQDKLRTQTQKGGNTAEFYQKQGTAPKSAMLVDIHPDVAKPAIVFKREHHDVDYTVFRNNWLIKTDAYKREMERRGWKPKRDKNPYGLVLVNRTKR